MERQINMGDNGIYNENNITHIIVNSVDYCQLEDDIKELEQDIINASNEEVKLRKYEKLNKKKQEVKNLKQAVFDLYKTFSQISLNTERLRLAKAHFEKGEFREADALLKASEISRETTVNLYLKLK